MSSPQRELLEARLLVPQQEALHRSWVTIIGAVVGAIVSLLVFWIIDSPDDDVPLTNAMAVANLASATDGFNGSNRSAPITMEFNKDSATYRITCCWEIA
jgi:hypothetical protein